MRLWLVAIGRAVDTRRNPLILLLKSALFVSWIVQVGAPYTGLNSPRFLPNPLYAREQQLSIANTAHNVRVIVCEIIRCLPWRAVALLWASPIKLQIEMQWDFLLSAVGFDTC